MKTPDLLTTWQFTQTATAGNVASALREVGRYQIRAGYTVEQVIMWPSPKGEGFTVQLNSAAPRNEDGNHELP